MTDGPSRVVLADFELRAASTSRLEDLPDDGWIPAVVPGGVHESLLAAGLLADPYRDENEAAVAWVEDEIWWYRTTFSCAPEADTSERRRLVFHGLDTVCTVFLNGTELFRHSNMFCPVEVLVTGRLQGQNTVHIRFEPPLLGLTPDVRELEKLVAATLPGATISSEENPVPLAPDRAAAERLASQMARTRRRKPTYSWGWDFAPRLPSVGLWRPVEVVTERRAIVRGHRLRTVSIGPVSLSGRADARLLVEVEAEAFAADEDIRAELLLSGPDGTTVVSPTSFTLSPGGGARMAGDLIVDVEAAELWWTHDLGRQPLYTAVISLRDAAGTLLDQAVERIGMRTIALDRSPDPAGEGNLFRFALNGRGLFARGANWVPASMFPGSVAESRLEALVDRAVDGRMNMIRIWGGGYYERDRFYELCDERGVLVWQDFMFACFDYPSDDPDLTAEVEQEAVFQVRRLRNHACLALWCGNNEIQAIHGMLHHDVSPGNWGYSFFHELLPRVVEAHDPGAVYWPGSPWSDLDPSEANGIRDGDRHAWEVWHGLNIGAGGPSTFASHGEAVHFGRYASDTGRFISEFGIHAAPEIATLERWTQPGSLALHSAAFDHRNKDNPKNKGDALMEYETGLPADLAEYVELSMVCQAEGLKFGIEHYRRREPRTSGTLVWQFNDVWPGITWSIVDYDGVPKASYHATRRAYAAVLASFVSEPDGSLELWLSNSGPVTVTGALRVEVMTYGGQAVVDETVEAAAVPGESIRVWQAPADRVAAAADRVAWVSSPDGLVEPNRLFFGRIKDQVFGSHRVEVSAVRDLRSSGQGVEVDIASHGYNYFTRIEAPYPGTKLTDNYFDMRDGQTTTVGLERMPVWVDPSTLRVVSYKGPADHELSPPPEY